MILHVFQMEKFISSYIGFINEECSGYNHVFAGFGLFETFPCRAKNFVKIQKTIFGFFTLIKLLCQADQVILHGLFNRNLIVILFILFWIPRKCLWLMWGGDLYDSAPEVRKVKEGSFYFVRKVVCSRLGGVITYLPGDYQRAREWLGIKSPLIEANGYLSNIYAATMPDAKQFGRSVILVGNSADPSNCHEEIFYKLQCKLSLEHKIFCPLSYGDMAYADKIELLGQKLFGDRFIALRNFMSLTEYNEIMQEVSVAIFAHHRQQAMGNTINLLGSGKKVVLREATAQFDLFKSLGVTFSPFSDFDLLPLGAEYAAKNFEVISERFSRERLIVQWRNIFSGVAGGE